MMKQRIKQKGIGLLRKGAACVLAVGALRLLIGSAPAVPAAELMRGLGGRPAVVKTLLRGEWSAGMAERDTGWEDLSPLQRLALRQAPALRVGAARQTDGDEEGTDQVLQPPAPAASDDGEDPYQVPEAKTPGNIVARTLGPSASIQYASAGGVYVYNRTSQPVDVAALLGVPLTISLSGDAPEILIMHTHGSEAYTMDGGDVYRETDAARTTDNAHNMIRVGEEMAKVFTEMGFAVLHDTELYDYPAYNGSYDRSKAAVQNYLAQYPSIKIVLDVHRDALAGENGTVYKAVTDIDGEKAAQVLLVIGTDDGGLSHPKWRENLALAVKLQQTMNSLWPSLARPISLRTSRFNQQLTTGSVLVEVGCHGNTLQEALRGARCFARAAGQVFHTLK